jgi:hypothetical protein
MKRIRLMRPEPHLNSRGPGNGIDGLRTALIEHGLPNWLALGGKLERDDIPWFWCWLDKQQALQCELSGRPYILGPCVFFGNPDNPGNSEFEPQLLHSHHCQMMFTDSAWYAEWLLQFVGPDNQAPIVVWPFPISPLPKGPADERPHLLIYEKSGVNPALTGMLRSWFVPNITIVYGAHDRAGLAAAAQKSWACAYMSKIDRGPLALEEIMLSGCPAVGTAHGAPWVEDGITGYTVANNAGPSDWAVVLRKCRELSAFRVRLRALERFSAQAVVPQVLKVLEQVARR